MSAKKQKWFELDEKTGKYKPLPVNHWGVRDLPLSSSKTDSHNLRKALLAQPWMCRKNESPVAKKMKIDNPNFKIDEKAGKVKSLPINNFAKPKTPVPKESHLKVPHLFCGVAANKKKPDMSVRKKLFKLDQPNSQIKKQKRQQIGSPLMDITEVEEEIINKGYPFRSPNVPVLKFSDSDGSSQVILPKTPNTSRSSGDSEFLEMEKICNIKTEKQKETPSPLSSVCNLLQNTMQINSVKKTKNPNSQVSVADYINEIKDMLKNEANEFEKFKSLYESNRQRIKETLAQIEHFSKDPVNNLKAKNIDKDKENVSAHKRRSQRLLNKSPTTENVSPVVRKAGDLRRSTLTKSLVKKCQQNDVENSRIQKALNLYNSIRGENSILCTPKLDRSLLNESPRNTTNLARSLSRRVQKQCLMLHDTPIHK